MDRRRGRPVYAGCVNRFRCDPRSQHRRLSASDRRNQCLFRDVPGLAGRSPGSAAAGDDRPAARAPSRDRIMLHDLWKTIVAAMSSWHQGKLFIEHSLSISHDSIHIIVGMLLWLAFGLLLRRPLTSWRPWAWLFA